MSTSPTTRRRLAILLLALGCLTTVATSAPEDHRLLATESIDLAAGATVHLRVELNEVAMDHARDNTEHASLSITIEGTAIRVVSDDEAFPPQDGTVNQVMGLDACPDTGGCSLGHTIESLGEATTVRVTAGSIIAGDSSFLFPADRSFPDDATATLVIDE